MDIYTKGIFKSNQDNADEADSNKMKTKIVGILENTGISYFKKPDNYKDIIVARKQTANFPPEINTLVGSRMMQSFYEDKVSFFDIAIPGPIAKNALDYYDYYIADSLAIDNKKVYKIHINTFSDSDPGFTGDIFILDKTFDLIKVDVDLNRAANVGGLLDTVNIFQQFFPYDSLYMPVDYRIAVKLNFLKLIKLSIDLNSVMYDYKINMPADNVLFDKAMVTVLPTADDKDSSFWSGSRFIPSTIEEKKAYTRIESIETAPKSLGKLLLLGLSEGEYRLNKNFSIASPLNMYHFNRVEGHSIDLGCYGKDLFDKRLNSDLRLHYGFADRKFKSEFGTSLLLGDYRTYNISFNIYNNILPVFNESNDFNDFTSSLFALAFNDDFLDYYYSKGFDVKFGGDVFPILNLNVGFTNRTDNNAAKNTDYSFSKENKKFRDNPPVYETKINSVDFNFKFDFRDYIEDGYFRRRDAGGNSYITLSGGVKLSSKSLLKSSMNFTTYYSQVEGTLNSFRLTNLDYKFFFHYSDDAVPYQMLYALPGGINGINGDMSFRTVCFGEYFGGKAAIVNLNYNFYDDFFRIFPVPLLKNWNLQVSAFFNAGWMDMSEKSKEILPDLPNTFRLLKQPLMEAGFGIGYMFLPIKLEFAWRLTHTNDNTFSVGINTAFLLK